MQADYALFAAVVEAGSLSGAARNLKLSPAMVSKRLAALEQRLGARLIQRTTRRLSLTDIGQAFHEQVTAILAAMDKAEAMVAGRVGTPSGRLRVSARRSAMISARSRYRLGYRPYRSCRRLARGTDRCRGQDRPKARG